MSRHIITLNEVEEEKLKELQQKFGFRFQEFVRTELIERYIKLLPMYAKTKEKEVDPYLTMTNEQYCTDVLGGALELNNEGFPVCIKRRPNGSSVSIILDKVKLHKTPLQ